MVNYRQHFLNSKAEVAAFAALRFPDERRLFDVIWAAAAEWLRGAARPRASHARPGKARAIVGEMRLVGQVGRLRLTVAIVSMQLACLQLEGGADEPTYEEMVAAAITRAREFRQLTEQHVVALGDFFASLMRSAIRPEPPYTSIEKRPGGEPIRTPLKNRQELERQCAKRASYPIFLDDVNGRLYADGKVCAAVQRNQYCYRLAYHLLLHPDTRFSHLELAPLVEHARRALSSSDASDRIYNSAATLRRTLDRASGRKGAAWIRTEGREVHVVDAVNCCLVVESNKI